jgi:hypothetical protein
VTPTVVMSVAVEVVDRLESGERVVDERIVEFFG